LDPDQTEDDHRYITHQTSKTIFAQKKLLGDGFFMGRGTCPAPSPAGSFLFRHGEL